MSATRNNGACSDAVHLAAESLLGSAVKGDPHAARALLEVPSPAWPDTTMQAVAAAIVELTADGAALELPLLLDRLTRAEVSSSRVGDLSAAPATCQPEKLAALLRDDWVDREQRRFHDLRARGALTAEELRTCLADLNLDAPGQRKAQREAVNTAAWIGNRPESISYLFEGLIARKALVLLTGMGGLGKSGVVLVLTLSGTIGRALFPSFRPTRRLRILWLCSEDDSGEVWRRWARVCDAYELTDEEREAFTKNCRLFCVPGVPLMDSTGKATQEYSWLKSEVAAFGPDLVVLDPLCHFH